MYKDTKNAWTYLFPVLIRCGVGFLRDRVRLAGPPEFGHCKLEFCDEPNGGNSLSSCSSTFDGVVRNSYSLADNSAQSKDCIGVKRILADEEPSFDCKMLINGGDKF